MKKRKRRGRPFYTASVFLIVLLFVALALVESMVLNPRLKVDLEQLDSNYAILVDVKSGWTMAKKQSTERIYPASLTKIMTAILSIEKISDLDTVVTVPSDIFGKLYEENASMAGFQPGEQTTVKDLLYGVLLPSGAECCLTLANVISGSEDAFAELMNQKAEKIGMKDTHFVNCTGLDAENHYSTVKDISKLLLYALNNNDFRAIFTSPSHTTAPTNMHGEGLTVYSTLFRGLDSPSVTGGEILGGKTGNTSRAGLCLASLAKVNGREYILVTAQAEDAQNSHIQDAVNVYSQIGNQ